MKLSMSNIAWDKKDDLQVYGFMEECGFSGLEIAPTRVFPETPYDCKNEAVKWVKETLKSIGLCVPSMQSIWYGKAESIFGDAAEREALKQYTEKAIDFAEAIGCKNLVFGCPKNRNVPDGCDKRDAVPFFKSIGEYALKHNTIIGMEANPTIYNTNYINDTLSAIELIKEVNSDGFLLNLDVGTMIQNNENPGILIGNVKYINHVHISEPYLATVKPRDIHCELKKVLDEEKYDKFVSIEMRKQEDINSIKNTLKYVADIFG